MTPYIYYVALLKKSAETKLVAYSMQCAEIAVPDLNSSWATMLMGETGSIRVGGVGAALIIVKEEREPFRQI